MALPMVRRDWEVAVINDRSSTDVDHTPPTRTKRRRTRRGLLAAFAVAGLVLASCSDADDTDSAAAAADDDVAKAANAIVESALDRPTDVGISAPLDGAVPEVDGPVYWIERGAPACVALGDALKEATDTLGWDLVRVNAGLSPETVKNAWGEAARANPAPVAVLGSGFPREVFEDELQSLAKRDIPTFNLSVNDEAGNGLTAVIGAGQVRNVEVGRLQAAYLLSRRGAETNAVFVKIPAFPSHEPQHEGFRAAFEELCPDCGLDQLELPAESMGTDLPQRLVAYLQANPDVNAVAIAYGDMAVGVPTALRDAGLADRVVVVTDTPDPTVAQYIKDNNVVIAATGYPGPEMMWRAIDITLRYLNDQDISVSAEAPLPQWIMTSETIPSTTDSFPLVEDYQAEFRKLWGLS